MDNTNTLVQYFFTESILIRVLRRIHNLSQQEFCRLLGYTQSALSKIENGQISPDLKFIVKLSQHIPIDLNIFRYGHIPKLPKNLNQESLYAFIPYKYLHDGFMSIKSMYLLIKTIEKNYNTEIFKKLQISPDGFCLSFVKLNLDFIADLIRVAPRAKLLHILQSSQNHFVGRLEDKQAALSYLISHNMINVLKIGHTKEYLQVACSLNKKFDPSLEHLEDLLILFICYDLKITFNVDLTTQQIKNKKDNLNFQLMIYAN